MALRTLENREGDWNRWIARSIAPKFPDGTRSGTNGASGASMKRETMDGSGLKYLIQLYHVGFWVKPDRTDIQGRTVEVTFQLELRGTHGHCRVKAGVPCRGCIRVLSALFEIADALLPIERDGANRIGSTYEKRIHYSGGCNAERGVALAFEIKTRRSFEQASNGWAMEFLQEVRQFLTEHGGQQFEPPESREKQTAATDDIDRLSPRVMREDDVVPAPVA